MLDLEVIPERSLSCESWEFILGKWNFWLISFSYLIFQFIVFVYSSFKYFLKFDYWTLKWFIWNNVRIYKYLEFYRT